MDCAKRDKIVTVRGGVLTEIVTVRGGVLTEIVTVRGGVLTEIQKVCVPKIYKTYYYPILDDNIKILEENNWPAGCIQCGSFRKQ